MNSHIKLFKISGTVSISNISLCSEPRVQILVWWEMITVDGHVKVVKTRLPVVECIALPGCLCP
jgi:hypothetical protein